MGLLARFPKKTPRPTPGPPPPPGLNCRRKETREQMLKNAGGLGVLEQSGPGKPEDIQGTPPLRTHGRATVSGPADLRQRHREHGTLSNGMFPMPEPGVSTARRALQLCHRVRRVKQWPTWTYRDKKLMPGDSSP